QEAAADPGFLERLKAKFWNVQAAPSASPAGAGHETDKARFGTVRVRAQVDGERRRVQLRLKRPEPQRIRERGGEIQLLKKQ
ncbi:MAG: hypothetical protein IKK73_06275, partial [Akkermansia sp.]|nr:hypothetical protein [Akkermansia sp.]